MPTPPHDHPRPATAQADETTVTAAYGELRRAVQDRRRCARDAAATARLLTVAGERSCAAERVVEQARARLVWALAVAPHPDTPDPGAPTVL